MNCNVLLGHRFNATVSDPLTVGCPQPFLDRIRVKVPRTVGLTVLPWSEVEHINRGVAYRLARFFVVDDIAPVNAAIGGRVLHCGSTFRRMKRHVDAAEIISNLVPFQGLIPIYVLVVFQFIFGR